MRSSDQLERSETFDEMRRRMIDDAVHFIEWGLANPHLAPRIPTWRVGTPDLSAPVRARFYALLLEERTATDRS